MDDIISKIKQELMGKKFCSLSQIMFYCAGVYLSYQDHKKEENSIKREDFLKLLNECKHEIPDLEFAIKNFENDDYLKKFIDANQASIETYTKKKFLFEDE